ncbi:MAG: 16S rRNA (guanine(527)-N(7))-methyltransferase RsmG [Eubacteriaceae bacterium]|nr:16S rRNA (guanine(527)-N(7))-methyltransferase RsmG [Eubacteriaceae bacterium]
MNYIEYLNECLISEGFELPESKLELLLNYMELVLEENKIMNLTSITDRTEFIKKHIVDSIIMYRGPGAEISEEIMNVADIGTGGGFPGIPLKIVHPHWKMTLVDSTEKKVRFIKKAAEALGLTGVEFLHKRAEEMGMDTQYREKYDIIFSRAVAGLNVLSEFCIPLVKKGGLFIASKGPKYAQEIKDAEKAIHILGGTLEKVDEARLLFEDMSRFILYIRKIKGTPTQFPRKQGLPTRKPL